MKNLFFSGDFDALIAKDDLIIPSKIDKADLSIIVYFRELRQDWLSFIIHLLSLSDIDLEIILVNDGSQVSINLPQDNRLGLISNIETNGEMVCLKSALKIAKGDYIKFTAYPDMISPAGMIAQIKELKDNGKDVCLGSVILTKDEENEELSACFDELDSLIGSDIKNVLIYKTAIFGKQFIKEIDLADDMYDDCIISLAGANSINKYWSESNTSVVQESVSLLNENPVLFDFLNMRRESLYSKGQIAAKYKKATEYGDHIKLVIIDNNLNMGGAQWSILQWAKLLPDQFKIKFLLYSEGALVPKAINDGYDIEIWDKQLPFEDWLHNRICEWKADMIDVIWNGELLTEKVINSAPIVVAHLQCQDIPWLDNLIAKKQISRIDHFIAVSESIKQKYSSASDKIVTINSPVDASRYLQLVSKQKTMRRILGLNDNDFVVNWCGRILSSEKRADLLRDVMDKIHREKSNIKFVISGIIDGNIRDKEMYILGWQKWCEDHDGSIILDLKPWEMSLFHSVGDVFLSLSDVEGLSLATLEALASKCPVISTDVGGQAEAVIPGITGILIEKGSSEQAVRAILEFYKTHQSTESKKILDLMGYLGQSLIGSECNLENIARQHAIAYINWMKNGH